MVSGYMLWQCGSQRGNEGTEPSDALRNENCRCMEMEGIAGGAARGAGANERTRDRSVGPPWLWERQQEHDGVT